MLGFARKRVDNEFPTPETVDILAEVSEFRMGRNIGYLTGTIQNVAGSLDLFKGTDRKYEREALIQLAAFSIARIELIDKGRVFD